MFRALPLRLVLLAACALPLAAADPPPTAGTAPTAAEWTPVQQALAAAAPGAETRLLALLRTYPKWADGNRVLAARLLEAGKAAEALAAARRAAELAPTDGEALRLQVRALAELKRGAEIWALVEQSGGRDPKGWLRYDAGMAALRLGDTTRATTYYNEAKVRSPGRIPAEFLFLDSRIAIALRDFPRAELALASATAQEAEFVDGWYELGRVRLVLADADGEQRAAWVTKAGEAFAVVAAKAPGDAAGHIGLARVAIEEAKRLTADGAADNAGARLHDAQAALRRALAARPDSAEAETLRGDVATRLEQWDEAVTALRRARDLGATDRTLTFNLAIALQQTGRAEEGEALLKSMTAISPAEQVTVAMGAYRSRNWLLATVLLTKAVDGLDDQPAQAATWRFIGHGYSRLAEGRSGADRETALDRAAEAYARAGALGDFHARRFLLASEAARSPERGYAAAWTLIGWDFLNFPAWGEAVRDYGAAKTGGAGIAGMAARAPLHLAIWGVLVLLPLIFWINHLRRRSRPVTVPVRPLTRPPPARPRASLSASATAVPAPSAASGRPTRPPAKRPVDQKTATEPIAPPVSGEKAETVAVASPPPARPVTRPGSIPRRPSMIIPPATAADQTMRPTPGPDGDGDALEKRRR